MTRFAPVGFLFSWSVICFFCYFPGLQGGFLFDDYPNLKDLGVYGGVVDWETFKSFVLNGFSGPTGRPIALASFLLDDNAWPSYAPWFKITNVLIHQLCGLLLCWGILLLLRLYGYPEKKCVWIGVLASMFWLLHPYFVSTTLYVVQRMAQLAALFSLLGVVVYLQGRLLVEREPRKAYVMMTLAVCGGTLLATFSKENGVLLPILLLVIEFCNPSNKKSIWQWSAAFLWLPAIAIIAALCRYVDFSDNPWPNRSFNQVERLLSEARIVSEYLYHLYVPRIEGRGLFQDGYPISKGLFAPITTFLSLFSLSLLAGSAFYYRKKWPLFSLAVLFFFAGHLTESTVVGLELYFEHRNYLAALFLFLPLAALLFHLGEKVRPRVAVVVTMLIIAMLALMTRQRAELWSDSERLELYWAYATPNSPRARNSIAMYLTRAGRHGEAEKELENATVALPDSAFLTINLLLQKIFLKHAGATEFASAGDALARQPFDAQAIMGLRSLVEQVSKPEANPDHLDMVLSLIDKMTVNTAYNQFPLFIRLMPYLRGQIYVAKQQPNTALKYYSDAMELYADTDSALMMVAEMATNGYFDQSLQLLDQAEVLYKKQTTSTLKKSRKVYDQDIELLRAAITQAMQQSEEGSTLGGAHQ